MYKMYNTQLDEESDDDSSSFWSDREKQDDEDEEEVERVMDEEESRPVAEAGDSLQKASEEEKPELINQGDFHRESLEDETDDDDDNDDEESCSSSSDSPAPSLMTSGYGTYRPEEQEGGGYGEDHTMTELDQDSEGDLSEMRDDEGDDRSLSSFGGFDIESTCERDYHKNHPQSVLTDNKPEANVACRGDDCLYNKDVNLEEDRSQADEQEVEDEPENKDVTNAASEEKHHVSVAQDKYLLNEKHLEDGCDPEEGKQHEMVKEVRQDLKKQKDVDKEVEDKVESDDPDESSSNKDIKFIDSKVDFNWMTYNKMCEEWEGNLRQKKGKWFPAATIIKTLSLLNGLSIRTTDC